MKLIPIIGGVIISLLAIACAPAQQDVGCPAGMEPFTEINMYFGQEKEDGSPVAEDEWQDFLANAVTPRFPDGLTVIDARGQWLDADNDRLYKEATKLLNVLVPAETSDAGINAVQEISESYKERFQQQAVFIVTSSVCAGIY